MTYQFQNNLRALDFYTKYYPKYEVELSNNKVVFTDRELMTPASRMGGTLTNDKRSNS